MLESIWSKYQLESFPRLNKNIETDVLVIGGGISGILCAYFLAQSGKDVVVLEAEKVADKKTIRTTAVITALQDVMYSKLPLPKAKLFLKANLFALEEYKKLSLKYDFDFEECSSFKYSTISEKEIIDEYNKILLLGGNVKYTTDIGLPIKFVKAIEMEKQGQMNPIKLINCLSKNLKIYEKSRVVKLKKNIAYTNTNTVTFNSVVVCTGYPFLKLKGLFPLKMHQKKSHVIAINNPNKISCNAVGTLDDNIYFRTYKDELLLGCCDIKTGYACDGFRDINEFIVKNYNIRKITKNWINEDTVTLDELPYIGRYGNSRNMYVSTGYNLWGMSASMIGAHLITDLINGENNEFAEVFSPSRKVLVKPLFDNVKTAINSLVSFNNKRCTHLGCRLFYNDLDKTYECKCHGSKYDCKGNVVDTPAQKNANI